MSDTNQASAGNTSALVEAMRRARIRQAEADPEAAPYAPPGSVMDRLSAMLPSWLSARAAVMQQRARLRQMDEQTAPEANR
jgi:hypothetical protein